MSDEPNAAPPPVRPVMQDSGSGAPVEEGAPTWVVTFGDMMSLLLTFFILMFSMSEIKVEKFLVASESLRDAMGSTAEAPAIDPIGLMPDPVDPEIEMTNPGLNNGATFNPVDGEGDEGDVVDVFAEAYMEMIAERLQALVDSSGLGEEVIEVVVEEEGVYLRIRNAALFTSGSATLMPESYSLVTSLSEITQGLQVPTIVSGHADSRPISTPFFPSNWELSAARAAGVARVLVAAGQDPEMIRVQSFGEFRAVADNSTAEGRAKNRRVELFFSQDEIRALAESLQGTPLFGEVPSDGSDGASTSPEQLPVAGN